MMIGGDVQDARFAISLGDNFSRGRTCMTRCFMNEILAHKNDFFCDDIEIWAFT